MQRATYWRMYGLYTFSLVFFLAAPGDVAFEAEERGFQILAGVALLIVGLAALHAIADRLATAIPTTRTGKRRAGCLIADPGRSPRGGTFR